MVHNNQPTIWPMDQWPTPDPHLEECNCYVDGEPLTVNVPGYIINFASCIALGGNWRCNKDVMWEAYLQCRADAHTNWVKCSKGWEYGDPILQDRPAGECDCRRGIDHFLCEFLNEDYIASKTNVELCRIWNHNMSEAMDCHEFGAIPLPGACYRCNDLENIRHPNCSRAIAGNGWSNSPGDPIPLMGDDDDPPVVALGSCCMEHDCLEVERYDCIAFGGVWSSAICGPDSCKNLRESACCSGEDGCNCTNLTESACTTFGGTRWLSNQRCDPMDNGVNPCCVQDDKKPGSCCFGNSCMGRKGRARCAAGPKITALVCAERHGIFTEGGNCGDSPCCTISDEPLPARSDPQLGGACCLDGLCYDGYTEFFCRNDGGVYYGDETTCEDYPECENDNTDCSSDAQCPFGLCCKNGLCVECDRPSFDCITCPGGDGGDGGCVGCCCPDGGCLEGQICTAGCICIPDGSDSDSDSDSSCDCSDIVCSGGLCCNEVTCVCETCGSGGCCHNIQCGEGQACNQATCACEEPPGGIDPACEHDDIECSFEIYYCCVTGCAKWLPEMCCGFMGCCPERTRFFDPEGNPIGGIGGECELVGERGPYRTHGSCCDSCCTDPSQHEDYRNQYQYTNVVLPTGDCVWMDCGLYGCPYPPCRE